MSEKKFSSIEVHTNSGAVSKSRAVNTTEETVIIDGKPKHVAPAVSGYVMALSEEKRIKEEKGTFATILRAFSKEVRNYFTDEKSIHRKTYRLLGKEKNNFQYAVDATETDKFSYSDDKEDMKALRDTLGEDTFLELFEEVTEIGIKKDIMDNKDKRKELTKQLIEKFGKEGIVEYFDRKITWKLKSGLAEKKHTLSKKVQETITEKFKQAADALKDASYEVK